MRGGYNAWMDENPYRSPNHISPSRPTGRASSIVTLAGLGLAGYVLSTFIAPADPVSVYIGTLLVWLLMAMSYAAGRLQSRRVERSETP